MKTPVTKSKRGLVPTIILFLLIVAILYYGISRSEGSMVGGIIAFMLIIPFFYIGRAMLILLVHNVSYDKEGFEIQSIFGVKKQVKWSEVQEIGDVGKLTVYSKIKTANGNVYLYGNTFESGNDDNNRFFNNLENAAKGKPIY